MVTPAQPKTFRVHDFMDGIRGLLMSVLVLLDIFYAAVATKGAMPWYNSTALWLQPGEYTAGLFVAISGFCLTLRVVQANGNLPGGAWRYIRRRFIRIVPAYYAAAGLSLAHVLLFPKQYERYGIQVDALQAGVLWSHLLLFYNLKPEWTYQINASYWSLASAGQLYVLFPLVLLPLMKKAGVLGFLVTGLLGTAALMLAGGSVLRMHPWFLFLFMSGMAGSVIVNFGDASCLKLRNQFRWDLAAWFLFGAFGLEWAALACFRPVLLFNLVPTWQQSCLNETMLGLAILALILHWSKIQQTRPMEQWPPALHFFNRPWLTGLGRFSYSLYLIHFPIVIAIASFIRSLQLPALATIALAYLVSVPVSLTAAYLFFVAIERRFVPSYLKQANAVAPAPPRRNTWQPGRQSKMTAP